MDQIDALLELQECDLGILRAKKQINELPEAAAIFECRERRKKIKAKQDQVFELTDAIQGKLRAFEAEQAKVEKKISELQATLDRNTDFRVTSAALRDMEGQAKRLDTIQKEKAALKDRQVEVDEKAAVIEGLLKDVDAKEQAVTEKFQRKGGAIKEQIVAAQARRKELVEFIDPSVLARYDKLRKEKGGIGLGHLEGKRCSACRAEFMDGQYQRLIHGEVLTECPSCHRVFIVTRDEA